jgi:HAD superfamily hydrolase (TIGR01509 family)
MAQPRAVLWDLDGTLVDSEEYHWRAWRDTMVAEGFPITREQFLASFGQRNDRILGGWLGGEVDRERVRRIGDAKEVLYRRLVAEEGLSPLPEAAEWVNRLGSAGWQQAIASSAPRENVKVVLRTLGLSGAFQAIVSAEDVSAGKPDPQVFLLAAARLGVRPARCVVVEDAAPGIEAARRAGMASIGVRGAATAAADLSVESLDELPPGIFGRLIERAG